MEKAISAVTREGLSFRRAALQFNVPKSSLGDQVSGRVAHGTMSAPSKYLTDAEEIEIVHFLELLQLGTLNHVRMSWDWCSGYLTAKDWASL